MGDTEHSHVPLKEHESPRGSESALSPNEGQAKTRDQCC